jgi:hypothetical protein
MKAILTSLLLILPAYAQEIPVEALITIECKNGVTTCCLDETFDDLVKISERISGLKEMADSQERTLYFSLMIKGNVELSEILRIRKLLSQYGYDHFTFRPSSEYDAAIFVTIGKPDGILDDIVEAQRRRRLKALERHEKYAKAQAQRALLTKDDIKREALAPFPSHYVAVAESIYDFIESSQWHNLPEEELNQFRVEFQGKEQEAVRFAAQMCVETDIEKTFWVCFRMLLILEEETIEYFSEKNSDEGGLDGNYKVILMVLSGKTTSPDLYRFSIDTLVRDNNIPKSLPYQVKKRRESNMQPGGAMGISFGQRVCGSYHRVNGFGPRPSHEEFIKWWDENKKFITKYDDNLSKFIVDKKTISEPPK